MAHDHNRQAHFVGRNGPPHHRRHTEKREQAERRIRHLDSFGGPETRKRQIGAVEGFECREGLRPIAPGLEGGVGDAPRRGPFVEQHLADGEELVGTAKRRGRQQDGVDNREDRRAGAKGQRNSQRNSARAGSRTTAVSPEVTAACPDRSRRPTAKPATAEALTRAARSPSSACR